MICHVKVVRLGIRLLGISKSLAQRPCGRCDLLTLGETSIRVIVRDSDLSLKVVRVRDKVVRDIKKA